MIRKVDPNETQKTGLRDTRHVIFDNGQRLLWTTTLSCLNETVLEDFPNLVWVLT
jgi:hypothetical protein